MIKFIDDIKRFQEMYNLPRPTLPTIVPEGLIKRQTQFMKILGDELTEGQEILDNYAKAPNDLEALVELSDWLGDMVVYCTSEAMRYGIPMPEVLSCIMTSNFSKLGEDGKAIMKEGKVQKGPNFFKPEPAIKSLLENLRGIRS
jgi:predicted HAD superfamily Cof-like phosphohydrolase